MKYERLSMQYGFGVPYRQNY